MMTPVHVPLVSICRAATPPNLPLAAPPPVPGPLPLPVPPCAPDPPAPPEGSGPPLSQPVTASTKIATAALLRRDVIRAPRGSSYRARAADSAGSGAHRGEAVSPRPRALELAGELEE